MQRQADVAKAYHSESLNSSATSTGRLHQCGQAYGVIQPPKHAKNQFGAQNLKATTAEGRRWVSSNEQLECSSRQGCECGLKPLKPREEFGKLAERIFSQGVSGLRRLGELVAADCQISNSDSSTGSHTAAGQL